MKMDAPALAAAVKVPALAAAGKVPAFVSALWSMLSDPRFAPIIHWSPHGDSFVIEDEDALESTVLPAFFATNSRASFGRQLNFYNVKRVRREAYYDPTAASGAGGSSSVEFRHKYLHRMRPDLLARIIRKTNRTAIQRMSDARDAARVVREIAAAAAAGMLSPPRAGGLGAGAGDGGVTGSWMEGEGEDADAGEEEEGGDEEDHDGAADGDDDDDDADDGNDGGSSSSSSSSPLVMTMPMQGAPGGSPPGSGSRGPMVPGPMVPGPMVPGAVMMAPGFSMALPAAAAAAAAAAVGAPPACGLPPRAPAAGSQHPMRGGGQTALQQLLPSRPPLLPPASRLPPSGLPPAGPAMMMVGMRPPGPGDGIWGGAAGPTPGRPMAWGAAPPSSFGGPGGAGPTAPAGQGHGGYHPSSSSAAMMPGSMRGMMPRPMPPRPPQGLMPRAGPAPGAAPPPPAAAAAAVEGPCDCCCCRGTCGGVHEGALPPPPPTWQQQQQRLGAPMLQMPRGPPPFAGGAIASSAGGVPYGAPPARGGGGGLPMAGAPGTMGPMYPASGRRLAGPPLGLGSAALSQLLDGDDEDELVLLPPGTVQVVRSAFAALGMEHLLPIAAVAPAGASAGMPGMAIGMPPQQLSLADVRDALQRRGIPLAPQPLLQLGLPHDVVRCLLEPPHITYGRPGAGVGAPLPPGARGAGYGQRKWQVPAATGNGSRGGRGRGRGRGRGAIAGSSRGRGRGRGGAASYGAHARDVADASAVTASARSSSADSSAMDAHSDMAAPPAAAADGGASLSGAPSAAGTAAAQAFAARLRDAMSADEGADCVALSHQLLEGGPGAFGPSKRKRGRPRREEAAAAAAARSAAAAALHEVGAAASEEEALAMLRGGTLTRQARRRITTASSSADSGDGAPLTQHGGSISGGVVMNAGSAAGASAKRAPGPGRARMSDPGDTGAGRPLLIADEWDEGSGFLAAIGSGGADGGGSSSAVSADLEEAAIHLLRAKDAGVGHGDGRYSAMRSDSTVTLASGGGASPLPGASSGPQGLSAGGSPVGSSAGAVPLWRQTLASLHMLVDAFEKHQQQVVAGGAALPASAAAPAATPTGAAVPDASSLAASIDRLAVDDATKEQLRGVLATVLQGAQREDAEAAAVVAARQAAAASAEACGSAPVLAPASAGSSAPDGSGAPSSVAVATGMAHRLLLRRQSFGSSGQLPLPTAAAGLPSPFGLGVGGGDGALSMGLTPLMWNAGGSRMAMMTPDHSRNGTAFSAGPWRSPHALTTPRAAVAPQWFSGGAASCSASAAVRRYAIPSPVEAGAPARSGPLTASLTASGELHSSGPLASSSSSSSSQSAASSSAALGQLHVAPPAVNDVDAVQPLASLRPPAGGSDSGASSDLPAGGMVAAAPNDAERAGLASLLLTMRGDFDTSTSSFFGDHAGAGSQPVAMPLPALATGDAVGISGVKRSRGDMEAGAGGDDEGDSSNNDGGGCPPAAKRRAIAVAGGEATSETAEV